MVSNKDQTLVYNIKLSSVGPAQVTGDVTHEPNGMDLAMKLHYLKGVYIFSSQASQGLTVLHFKESLFYWLNDYYITCGRFRRSETGRPCLKCNDCGVRFVEAECDKTVDEWLEMRDASIETLLVYHQPIGPELSFSPPVYIQVTKFKCGGMSLGLSWAHILGDTFSVVECMNIWGQFLGSLRSNGPLKITKQPSNIDKLENPPRFSKEPLSLKRVNPVGDHWVTPNNCKMETFSFHLTALQVSELHSRIWGQSEIAKTHQIFESLCAIIWQCIAKVKEDLGLEPSMVTLLKNDPNHPRNGVLSNGQIINSVEADFSVVGLSLKELAMLLVNKAMEDEKSKIKEVVEREMGTSDYIVYGSNLTFVDLEEANLYGLEWNGQKPEFVHYTIQGVGDEGVVVVLPWRKDSDKDGNQGRVVTVTLPENEVVKLKLELRKNGLLAETDLE